MNTQSSRFLAPYCLLFLPTTDSFPNCMATSQTQKHRYTSRTPCSVLKKHLLPAVAGFTRAIILCQASKSQLHKLCLILIVPTLFFLILCLSLAQACKLSSESTHGSQEHLREDVAGGLLRSRLKIELNSHEAPKNSEISLSLRHKCLENQTLLVLLMAETPSLSRIQVLKDPA